MYTSRKLTDAETRIINRSIKRPLSFPVTTSHHMRSQGQMKQEGTTC